LPGFHLKLITGYYGKSLPLFRREIESQKVFGQLRYVK
jgi:hypothetical protein